VSRLSLPQRSGSLWHQCYRDRAHLLEKRLEIGELRGLEPRGTCFGVGRTIDAGCAVS
jgi:hypothetical protein